jgi:hypothetical protein
MSDSVIFFDFNGVLDIPGTHSNQQELFFCVLEEAQEDKLKRLAKLAGEVGALLVPISMYRSYIGSYGFMSVFERKGIKVDMDMFGRETPCINNKDLSTKDMSHRGGEINLWLKEENHNGPYIVIDDEFIGGGHPHIRTQPSIGFDEKAYEKAIELLKSQGVACNGND